MLFSMGRTDTWDIAVTDSNEDCLPACLPLLDGIVFLVFAPQSFSLPSPHSTFECTVTCCPYIKVRCVGHVPPHDAVIQQHEQSLRQEGRSGCQKKV